MKKFLTVCLAAGTLAASALGFSACSGNTLVVYTEAGFPPFEYRSENSIVGVDVDIMNMVGERLGMDVHFESVDFDIIIDTVSQGRLANVGAAGISITEERKEKVDFSIPYYTASLYVIYRADGEMAPAISESTAENGSVIYWDSLVDMTIGVQGGTTADLFLTDEINEDWGVLYNTETNKRSFDSLSVAVNDIGLNSNVVIIDELPARTLVANNEGLACLPLYYRGETVEEDEAAVDEYAIAVTKGETELLAAIDAVLQELIDDVDADGNNGIDRLIMQHLDLASN
mgnify:FL=1